MTTEGRYRTPAGGLDVLAYLQNMQAEGVGVVSVAWLVGVLASADAPLCSNCGEPTDASLAAYEDAERRTYEGLTGPTDDASSP